MASLSSWVDPSGTPEETSEVENFQENPYAIFNIEQESEDNPFAVFDMAQEPQQNPYAIFDTVEEEEEAIEEETEGEE